ncbi:phosphopantetheine-binding protein [Actinokineospora soli]|uniref:Phosphopantetheine-binding protein n=1 Tax=Actinokineospora soli TaxID=1048753 RepID=A0ABW2TQI5_9PSEU
MIWTLISAIAAAAASVTAAVVTAVTARKVGRWQLEAAVTVAEKRAAQERELWRAQSRRQTYGRFLAVASEAREELWTLWHLLRRGDADLAKVEERFAAARALIYSVQRAAADVNMEGPVSLRGPLAQTEEDLGFFFAGLRALHRHQVVGDDEVRGALELCAVQRVEVRLSITAFAEAASAVLHGPVSEQGQDRVEERPAAAEADLAWLAGQMARILGIAPERVDLSASPVELGFDSILYVEFAQAVRARYGITPKATWMFNALSLSEIALRLTLAQRSVRSELAEG